LFAFLGRIHEFKQNLTKLIFFILIVAITTYFSVTHLLWSWIRKTTFCFENITTLPPRYKS